MDQKFICPYCRISSGNKRDSAENYCGHCKTFVKSPLGFTYILDRNRNPVRCHDVAKWGEWFNKNENTLIRESIPAKGVIVRTYFLGYDPDFGGKDYPDFFITSVTAYKFLEKKTLVRFADTTCIRAEARHERIVSCSEWCCIMSELIQSGDGILASEVPF